MSLWPWLVDGLIVLIVGFGAWRGYKEGVFGASANLIGLVASLVLAYFFYASIAGLLLALWHIPRSIANVFAFLLLAFLLDGIVSTLVVLGSTKLRPAILQAHITHALGVIPGVLNSLITIAYLASLFIALPVDHPIKAAFSRSVLAPPLASAINRLGAPVDQLVKPAIADLSQLFTIEPDSKELVTLAFTSQNPAVDPVDEAAMLALLNQERTSRGLMALRVDPKLTEAARAHSLDMFQRGYFSHYTPEGKDPFDRMKDFTIEYTAAGENLALAPTVHMAHTGLMNSPGHKRNILDTKYRNVGIGAYKDPRYGIMFSQEFTD